MFGRLLALMKKEFLAIKNDKKSLVVVILPPLVQVIIFSFAATLEMKHFNMAVLDRDGSRQSSALIREFTLSPNVKSVQFVKSYEEGAELINTQKVLAFAVIPDNFAKALGSERSDIQLILDGRHSNTAQIAEGYISQMVMNFQEREGAKKPLEVVSRNFYNPNLDNFWWIVPNLFGSITMIVAMLLTSLSIARERELGTFDQIMVSPLRPFEILLGKLLPALIISLFESTIILFAAINFFEVPLTGSIWLLYLSVALFLFSMSGIGLFISAVAQTQQQAILGSFVVLLPSFLLSGFATPVENIPQWLQPLTDFIPLKYYILLIKGCFLKDISFSSALPELIPMFLLGIVFLSGTLLFFKKKIV
jgi:ABC-2 type transport system permease protein